MNRPARRRRDVVVIGGSAGALEPLGELVRRLPSDLPASLAVVLHMSPWYPSHVADILARDTRLAVAAAVDGEPMLPGRVYVSVADRHLRLTPRGLGLDRAPREHFTRPAIDPLFRSAAAVHRDRVVGVLLSGGGHDGTLGLLAIKAAGGTTLVQDPKSARHRTMLTWAIDNADVDRVLSIAEIADEVIRQSAGLGLDEAPSAR